MIENRNDSTEFTLLEKWSNEEVYNTHFAINLIQNALLSLSNLISNDPDLRVHISRLNMVKYGTNSYCLMVT